MRFVLQVPENTGHFFVVTFPLAIKGGNASPHHQHYGGTVPCGNGRLHYNLLEEKHLSFQFDILYRSFQVNGLYIILRDILCSSLVMPGPASGDFYLDISLS